MECGTLEACFAERRKRAGVQWTLGVTPKHLDLIWTVTRHLVCHSGVEEKEAQVGMVGQAMVVLGVGDLPSKVGEGVPGEGGKC